MLGKNKGKSLPPRKKKSRVVQAVPSSSTNALPGSASSMTSYPVTVPHKFGSIASGICFPDTIDPRIVDIVLQC